jgi:hypothetical protein
MSTGPRLRDPAQLSQHRIFAAFDRVESEFGVHKIHPSEDNYLSVLKTEMPDLLGAPKNRPLGSDEFEGVLDDVYEIYAHRFYHRWTRAKSGRARPKQNVDLAQLLLPGFEALPKKPWVMRGGRRQQIRLVDVAPEDVRATIAANQTRIDASDGEKAGLIAENEQWAKLLPLIETGEVKRRLDRFDRGEAI